MIVYFVGLLVCYIQLFSMAESACDYSFSPLWHWTVPYPEKYLYMYICGFSPLTPTVATWVQIKSILCQTGLSLHLKFLTSGHADAQGWASECPDVKKYKWLFNLVLYKMLYSCSLPMWQQWASKDYVA